MLIHVSARAVLTAALLASLAIGQAQSTITLTPATSTGPLHSTHTVTATLARPTSLAGGPLPQGNVLVGLPVMFNIVGPNAGAGGTCGGGSCVTDTNQQVTFTYTGMNPGTDVIRASFVDPISQQTIITSAQKTWSTECYLLLGSSRISQVFGPDPADLLQVQPLVMYPITVSQVPPLFIPNAPSLVGSSAFAQVLMINPVAYPRDPLKFSNGWEVRIGLTAGSYGQDSGILLAGQPFPALGQNYHLAFAIQ